MTKVVGILGGMGPLATVDLFSKIVSQTEVRFDEDHIHIIIDNNTQIPSRINYIFNSGESPLGQLIKSAVKLEMMGADVIVMPCVTAHYFYNDIVPYVQGTFINMVEETVKEVDGACKVGLLSSEGTSKLGIFDEYLHKYNIDFIKPDTILQKHVTNIIYDVKRGEKDFNKKEALMVLERMKEQGAELFILGCTELPVAFRHMNIHEPYIDSTDILARRAIEFVGKRVIGAGT